MNNPANDEKLQAILLFAAAGVIFEIQAALVRYLSENLEIIFIAATQNIVIFLIFLFIALIKNKKLPKTNKPKTYILRGIIWMFGFLFYIWSISLIPLSNVASLSLTGALFTAALGILRLKEDFSKKDIMAMLLGFIGALIVIKPGTDVFHYGSMFVIASSLLWAWSNLILKRLTSHDDNITINLYTWAVISVCLLPFAIYYWQDISVLQILAIIATSIMIALFMMLATISFKHASLVTLAPFWFIRPILASIFGFFFFSQTPDIWTFIGAAIIIKSALYIAAHHRKATDKNVKIV